MQTPPQPGSRFHWYFAPRAIQTLYGSSDQRFADVDIYLTLSMKWRNAQALDRNLKIDDVAFLADGEGERGAPVVYGGAVQLNTTVVASLLYAGTNGKVRLVLPTVLMEEAKDAPYVWGRNRPNMFRISHLTFPSSTVKVRNATAKPSIRRAGVRLAANVKRSTTPKPCAWLHADSGSPSWPPLMLGWVAQRNQGGESGP